MTKAPPTQQVIDAFILSAQATNVSPKYIGKLHHTLNFLARAAPLLPTRTDQLDTFLASLAEHKKPDGAQLSDATKNEIRASTKRLYAWISDRYGTPNPAARLRKTRMRRTLPRVLTQQDVNHLLDANKLHHPRDYAMLSVIIDTMARIGEAASLTWTNLRTYDLGGGEVDFSEIGKQGARSAPINPSTVAAVRRAHGLSPGQPAPRSGPLWLTPAGDAMTYWGAHTATRRAIRRAGLAGNPHILRHTAATLFVKNGGDLFHLMRIGGWSTLKAVEMYVHLANSDVRDQHARFSAIAQRDGAGGQQLRLLEATS